MAVACVLTQIIYPIMLNFEPQTEWYAGIPWYKEESNVFYYIGNSLSTIADIILQVYCLVYMVKLQKKLAHMK